MPVASTDIIVFGSANMPEDDASTSGGAIDKSIKILDTDMSDIGGADTLDVVSDDASDSLTLTITGRLANGVVASEAYTVSGTTPQTGSTSFARILKMVISGISTYQGTLTITENSGSQTLATMESSTDAPTGVAVTQIRRPFYNAKANASGGDDKTLYEKVFVANTHASLALLDASIELTTDNTANNRVDFDLESVVSGTESVTDRLTAPTGLAKGAWNDTLANIPNDGYLGPLGDEYEHIGVWLRLYLPDGEAPENSSVVLTASGSTT